MHPNFTFSQKNVDVTAVPWYEGRSRNRGGNQGGIELVKWTEFALGPPASQTFSGRTGCTEVIRYKEML